MAEASTRPVPTIDPALAKILNVMGPDRGRAAIEVAMRRASLTSLRTPDDRFRFASALMESGGIFVAIGWTLAVGGYMVLFWSVAGQTPGMRVMGVRVVDAHGNPPGFGRSIIRFIGLVLAIIPCFLGFLPVLIDDRRRGIQDMLAGTVVLYADTAEPAATPPSSPAPAT